MQEALVPSSQPAAPYDPRLKRNQLRRRSAARRRRQHAAYPGACSVIGDASGRAGASISHERRAGRLVVGAELGGFDLGLAHRTARATGRLRPAAEIAGAHRHEQQRLASPAPRCGSARRARAGSRSFSSGWLRGPSPIAATHFVSPLLRSIAVTRPYGGFEQRQAVERRRHLRAAARA